MTHASFPVRRTFRCSTLRLAFVVLLAACTGGDTPADAPDSDDVPTPSTAVMSGPFEVRDAWARAADSGATGGAYVTLANMDTLDVTITGWSADAAESTELHETMVHDGMAHMTPHTQREIPRDSVLVMQPGGMHIMLMRLTRALRAGDTILITASLADGRAIDTRVAVRAP